MGMTIRFTLALLILFAPAFCWASEETETIFPTDDGEQESASPMPTYDSWGGKKSNIGGLASRVGLGLGLILLLIVGAVFGLRALGGGRRFGTERHVHVLDRCFLAPKRALYTVRMGERVVVVGVTDSSITPVLELSPDERDRVYPPTDSPAGDNRRFSGILGSLMRKNGEKT